jgi:uncharacterized membrane protein
MRKWFGLAALGLAGVFTAIVYSRLPEQIPTHWNLRGEVDGWSGRTSGALSLLLVGLGIWVLLQFLPRIDPRKENYAKFRGTYDLVANSTITFLAIVHVLVLGAGLGWPISIPRLAPIGVGAIFVLLGNVLPRARPNWFFGVRTPWTLSSYRVWERTHRVAGYLFVGTGILLIVIGALPVCVPFEVVPVAAGAVALIVLVYSYVLWRGERAS